MIACRAICSMECPVIPAAASRRRTKTHTPSRKRRRRGFPFYIGDSSLAADSIAKKAEETDSAVLDYDPTRLEQTEQREAAAESGGGAAAGRVGNFDSRLTVNRLLTQRQESLAKKSESDAERCFDLSE